MTWADGKDAVLFALALYGAGLSTSNWWQSRSKERRTVNVNCGQKYPVLESGNLSNEVWAYIEATNVGARPVTMTSIGLLLPDGQKLVSVVPHTLARLADTRLPATLTDGQSAEVHYTYLGIAEALMRAGLTSETKLIPFCKDSAGGMHKGKPWTVTAEQLLDFGR